MFLDAVVSLVLTCVSNRQAASLTHLPKTQAFSFAIACMCMPRLMGIWPCYYKDTDNLLSFVIDNMRERSQPCVVQVTGLYSHAMGRM